MQLESVSPADHIVIVMGPTGCGKSTFISAASNKGHDAINHGQASAASGVQTIRAAHPEDGHPVVFVDTPGFDDTYVPDTDTLHKIADWLVKTHKTRVRIGTVIYLHRITDNRMSATQLRNLQTFAKLCGPQAMPNAVIATTMWDDVCETTGVGREQELRAQFWNSMLVDGCRLERFQNTYESAWDIIGQHSSTTLRLPDEMVDAGKLLHQTEAYSINDGLPKWVVDLKIAFRTNLLRRAR